MLWIRRGFVAILSSLLLIALVGAAFSTSTNEALGNPVRIEAWLNQNHFYPNFISYVTNNAISSINNGQNTGLIALSNNSVKQAAQSAFTYDQSQHYLDSFLNSNYAWLEGKIPKPDFSIDLTGAKQSFANQIAQDAQNYLTNLPVCTNQQLAALGNINNFNPLNATCRPEGLDIGAEATTLAQEIENNTSFLSTPLITADNLSLSGSNQNEPYYKKLSSLPKYYRYIYNLPWLYAAIAFLCAIGIFFLAPGKRRGLRRIGIVLTEAGVILIAIKFLADALSSYLQKQVVKDTSLNNFQSTLTGLIKSIEHEWINIDFIFGIAFLIVGLAIFAALMLTRDREKRREQTRDISTPASEPVETTTPPVFKQPIPTPRPKQPPRLIQ